MDADELPVDAVEFLLWLETEQGRAANTVAAYRRDLLHYVAWLTERGHDLDTVDAVTLEELLADRRLAGAAPSSIARQLAAIRMLHRYLVIHAEVRKLYPGAEVPVFEFETPAGSASHDTLVIHYRSKRQLCQLAEGFIAGAADHFKESVGLSQPSCMLEGAVECQLVCKFDRKP